MLKAVEGMTLFKNYELNRHLNPTLIQFFCYILLVIQDIIHKAKKKD